MTTAASRSVLLRVTVPVLTPSFFIDRARSDRYAQRFEIGNGERLAVACKTGRGHANSDRLGTIQERIIDGRDWKRGRCLASRNGNRGWHCGFRRITAGEVYSQALRNIVVIARYCTGRRATIFVDGRA